MSFSFNKFSLNATNEGTISPETPKVYDNFNVIGKPVLDTSSGIVYGFSGSNYLKLKNAFSPNENTWEIGMKFITSSDTGTKQVLFHSCVGTGTAGRYGIFFQISDGTNTLGKFSLGISDTDSSWLVDEHGTHQILGNTTYWVKFGWNGTEYYMDYSLDGETYTRDITYSSDTHVVTPLINSYIGIYSYEQMQQGMLGLIQLADCYIKEDGSNWWLPYSN